MKVLCVLGRHAYGDPARGEGYEHAHFVPALRRMGHQVELFESLDKSAWGDYAELNVGLVERAIELRPDVIFFVLLGYEVWTETLDLLRRCTSAALVNWSTDDSWKYAQFSRFVAAHFDLYVTTCSGAIAWARRDRLDNFHLSQWAADSDRMASPLASNECRFDVTFVGAAYGNRPAWVTSLRQRGIEVECFGHGWPGGAIRGEDIAGIMRQSRVSLNFADSGRVLSGWRLIHSRQIKARTFEVPGAGGCLVTESAEGLEDFFAVGEEILTFSNVDELVSRIGQCLADPAWRDRIARAGHARTRAHHTYERRFSEIFARLPALPTLPREPVVTPDAARIEARGLARMHEIGPVLRLMRTLWTFPFGLVWGRRRGPRAARRALFEVSWRIAGSLTYSVRGLPGRLYFRES